MSQFSESQKNTIAEALIDYRDRNELSLKDLEARLGPSSANLSHITSGKWTEKTISDNIWEQIRQKLGIDELIVETDNYKRMMALFAQAQATAVYRIVDGHTGSGKTFTLNMGYVAKGHKYVYPITIQGGMTAKDFAVHLARITRVNTDGSRTDIINRVSQRLAGLHTGGITPLLVIDEAENANNSVHANFKSMYDLLKGQVSIILMGANNYYTHIQKAAMREKTPFAQLYSRFKTRPLILPSFGLNVSTTLFMSTNGVTSTAAQEMLIHHCSNYRELQDIINEAKAIMQVYNLKRIEDAIPKVITL